ncbi:MAG: patatin-like phospholipase family protein [Methyloceanibacter sp.]
MRNGESSGDQDAPRPSSLALIEAFSGLPPRQLADLETRLITLAVRRGEILVRQGDEADALYLVASGRFAVDVDGRRVAEVGGGAPIGEVAFFADGKRTATVTALRDSIVLKLPRADFLALTELHPAILKPITVTLARRLADTLAGDEQAPKSRPRTIAVIGAGQSSVPEAFRRAMTSALARYGEVSAVDSTTLAAAFPGDPTLASDAVTSWFNKQELRYHYVLYFADAELTPFSRKAIRQADHVILVGVQTAAPAAPKLNALESFAFEIHPASDRRLVLLHESRGPISGTSHWLDLRPVAFHHHLVVGEDADYDRLARFISGTAIGFVAGGGGALCAAHIGVYRALTEAGFAFDFFGGASGGGAMAAAFAMGASPEEVSRRTADIFLKSRAMKRLTWPRYSLLDHTVFDRALKSHYGETDIEDLWTGYFAVSTCLASNTLCLITRGAVWKAVRATSSIPGLLPPVYHEDGRMLVDGSLLDNVPVKSMRALKSGPNVVVNLRAEDVRSAIVDYATLPSRGQLVMQLLNPFRWGRLPQAPGVATVLLRSLMVHRERLSDTLTSEDLLIAPPLPEDIGVMDWHRHEELSASAYDYAAKLIEGLRASGHPLFR